MSLPLKLWVKVYFLFLLLSCENNSEKTPSSPILPIKTITALANCEGPLGTYTTNLYSDLEGYTLFQQVYSYREKEYLAITYFDSTGYSVLGDSLETLSKESIFTIKGHEFHKIALFPEQYFYPLCGADCDTLHTKDKLGNPATLYFDEQQRLQVMKFLNPFNTEESIEVFYKDYLLLEGHWVAHTIDIIQDRKDTYSFHFSEIAFNDPSFRYLETNSMFTHE